MFSSYLLCSTWNDSWKHSTHDSLLFRCWHPLCGIKRNILLILAQTFVMTLLLSSTSLIIIFLTATTNCIFSVLVYTIDHVSYVRSEDVAVPNPALTYHPSTIHQVLFRRECCHYMPMCHCWCWYAQLSGQFQLSLTHLNPPHPNKPRCCFRCIQVGILICDLSDWSSLFQN